MKPILPSRVQPCPLARTTPPYPFSLRRPGVLDVGVPRGVVGATAHASVCELLPFFVRGMDDFEYKAVCVCMCVCIDGSPVGPCALPQPRTDVQIPDDRLPTLR